MHVIPFCPYFKKLYFISFADFLTGLLYRFIYWFIYYYPPILCWTYYMIQQYRNIMWFMYTFTHHSSLSFFLLIVEPPSVRGIKPLHTNKKEPGGDLLSRLLRGSIIGVGGLNFRVRKGNGCNTSTITTRQLTTGLGVAARYNPENRPRLPRPFGREPKPLRDMAFANGNDNMVKPHGRLVAVGWTCYHA